MPPCRLRRRKFWKSDHEMVHSEVYLNKYVVSIAPFSTPTFTHTPTPVQKTALFRMFLLLNFSSIFPGGSPEPICPYVQTPMAVERIKCAYSCMSMGYPPDLIDLLAKLYRKQLARVKVAGTECQNGFVLRRGSDKVVSFLCTCSTS